MSRNQKIQEFFIQMLVTWFAFSSLASLIHRPLLNRSLALIAIMVCLIAATVHYLNSLLKEKFYKPQTFSNNKKLWKFFLISIVLFIGLTLWSLLPLVGSFFRLGFYFLPLIFIYPMIYFYQSRWYPRVLVLFAVLLITYSHMAILKNDRLHQKMSLMVRSPKGFQPSLVDHFDKSTLTSAQANDVAWILTTHPDESLRDYEKAVEFATIGLKIESRLAEKRNLADTLTCAHLAQKNKDKAEALIKEYELVNREPLLKSDELCESTVQARAPASVRKRKYKYYF